MGANPKQVMRILDYRGIDLRLEDAQLVGRCRDGPMPDDMVRFIQHFKELIVAELAKRERSAAGVPEQEATPSK